MPAPPRPRVVTLVLVDRGGAPLGALPPFEVPSPWYQEIEPVVAAVRQRHRLEVTVLRLLEAPDDWPGGPVSYLAEVAQNSVPGEGVLLPWAGTLEDHPLRMPWARPGSPAADVAWAQAVLAARGLRQTAPAQQVRSWNLSSLWRLPLEGDNAWLKSVPPFFEHEGSVLECLAGGPVPPLIGHAGRRMLLEEVPGEDLYDASPGQLEAMVEQLVVLQAGWAGRTAELLAVGLPDWRAPALATAIADVKERAGGVLEFSQRRSLDAFVDGLEERFEQVAECGLPDTIVHGDFHPGNHRGYGDTIVLLDWGDSGIGQPLLDQAAFLDRVPAQQVPRLRQRWHEFWQSAAPGSQPRRAARLLAPVAAARQAVIYQKFLDNIEPSEQPYHRDDPVNWLLRTVELLSLE